MIDSDDGNDDKNTIYKCVAFLCETVDAIEEKSHSYYWIDVNLPALAGVFQYIKSKE
jgi:hypothetical protein